jgi:uncharacterized membrane protein
MSDCLENPSHSKKNVGNVERVLSTALGAAAIVHGVNRGSLRGWIVAGVGAGLIYRGLSGRCELYRALKINTHHKPADETGIKVEVSTRINKPRHELYDYWRKLEHLPQIMSHLVSVKTNGNGRSHWTARSALGSTVEWDAEIINDIPNELIAWKSTSNSSVPNTGSVRFEELDAETEVRVNLQYYPPMGLIGATLAKMFGEDPLSQIREDLRRFKMLMETGAIATAQQLST